MPLSWKSFKASTPATSLELYERFQRDPHSVDPATREFFRPSIQEPRHRTRTSNPEPGTPEPGTPEPRRQLLTLIACRRRQPGAVDPPLRPPGGDRSIRSAAGRSAIRRSSRRRTASPTPISRAAGDPDRRARSPSGATSMADVVARLRGDLLLDDRLRLRAHLRARRAALAARGDRDRAVPRAGRSDRPDRAARSADRRRGVREVPASHVSRARRASRSKASTCSCRSSTR